MSAEEQEELTESGTEEGEEFTAGTEDVPLVLQTFMGTPYALGEALLELAVETEGDGAVDDLFREPPTTDEHLLDPWTLFMDDDEALGVTEPSTDGEEFDRGQFGALFLVRGARRARRPDDGARCHRRLGR
ncbi:MAG: hypothetical protein U5K30_17405 [Acidimicrobiales bacterium]|nr:hypothetical protein [Acidimicrobiales bacterium]